MDTITILNGILQDLRTGSLASISNDNVILMNATTMELLSLPDHSFDQVTAMGLLVVISNILYNNTDREILPIEDGVYDILLSLYKKYNPNYQVGAEPIVFESSIQTIAREAQLINPIRLMDNKVNDFLFLEELVKAPKILREECFINPITLYTNNKSKISLDTKQTYPKLVGTLDKCKFVLNSQAIERGVFDDANVEVFERDFIQKHISSGILDPNREFCMILELKCDGVSVAAEIAGDEIVSATSRGDTNNDVAADLSPVFQGYKFLRARDIPKNNVFGMKFEAVITYENLRRLAISKGRQYKNARNAISGILSSLDAYLFRDFITLIPLATSLDTDRLVEVEFMNTYYNSGEFLRYSIIKGGYKEILFQVKKFVEEAEYMRAFIPYMYDGVVVSYVDDDLVQALGRENSVNKYSTAIKFNALKKQTIFLGYTYTVGQNGAITPMIHYNPVEFYGTIHDKSTGHSYKRFRELGLRQGDIINVEYTNDVMPYVTKPMLEDNGNNLNELEEFIKICPSCNTELVESDSGKSMICNNINCPDRNISRMVNMLQKLNLKDFSEAAIRAIAKFSLTELMALTVDEVKFLGEANSQKFIDRINQLKNVVIYDYKILGALGFSSIAAEKWKLILNKLSVVDIITLPDDVLKTSLVSIKGIGPTAADIICDEREFFMNDLITISTMKNILTSIGVKSGKSIRFTGMRNKDLANILNDMGHDASEAGVTKTTDILIVPYEGYVSSKISKAGPTTIIVPYDKFIANMDKYL